MLFFKSENLIWTQHSLAKLKQYRLSASRVLRVLRHPKRREVGVAENTVACVQAAGTGKHPYEIWVMWCLASARDKARGSDKKIKKIKFDLNRKTIIISAWRYPGISPVHEPPPIPDDVWEVLRKMKKS